MKNKNKQWLKKNEPWTYDAFYGDPVTGSSRDDVFGCVAPIFIIIVAL